MGRRNRRADTIDYDVILARPCFNAVFGPKWSLKQRPEMDALCIPQKIAIRNRLLDRNQIARLRLRRFQRSTPCI